MVTYTVNMAQVQEIAGQMGTVARNIQGLLANLDDGTKMHLAEWTADSQQAYAVAKAKWDQKAADMALQAANAEASLSNINLTYANAETQGTSLWGR